MNLSAKTEYACIAVLELAARSGSPEPVRIRDIAEAHGIPSRFLVQILLQLKGAGLVSSTRGAAGGYQLSKEPSEITLGEVMAVVEGQNSRIASSTSTDTTSTQVLLATFQEAAQAQQDVLNNVTFADLVEQVRGRTEDMYYI
jgi:Rrf2 family protein